MHPLLVPATIVELVVLSNDTSADEGETVSLTCVGYGLPGVEIRWVLDGETLTNISNTLIYEREVVEGNMTFFQSVLQLCSVELTDAGSYFCVVSNGIMSTNSSVQLSVTGKNSNNLQNMLKHHVATFSSQHCGVDHPFQ